MQARARPPPAQNCDCEYLEVGGEPVYAVPRRIIGPIATTALVETPPTVAAPPVPVRNAT